MTKEYYKVSLGYCCMYDPVFVYCVLFACVNVDENEKKKKQMLLPLNISGFLIYIKLNKKKEKKNKKMYVYSRYDASTPPEVSSA